VEQQLPAGLGEGQIAEFVEHDEVQTSEIIGKPSLATRSPFGLEPIDQVDSGKNRPRDPARIQLRAMAMAKCVLPVPVEAA